MSGAEGRPRVFADPGLERKFAREGWVVLPLLDPRFAAGLADSAQLPEDLRRGGFTASLMSADLEARRRIDAAIRAAIEEPLRGILPFHRVAFCNFAVKPPGGMGVVPLHQDCTFVDENRWDSVGLWLPLRDVGPGDGCLHVVGGSHRFGGSPRAMGEPFRWPDALADIRAGLLRPVPMRAGEAMLFHPRLFHASEQNESDAVRIAAAAVTVPRESRLWYVHLPRQGGDAEIFEVEDDYYLELRIGERPAGRQSSGTVARSVEPIDLDQLRSVARVLVE